MNRVRTVRALGAVHDLLCGALALPLAFLIRTGELPEVTTSFLVMQVTLVISIAIFSFVIGLNQGSWRYASIDDLLGIIETAVLSVIVAVLVTFAVSRLEAVPRAVPVIACACLIVLMGTLRLSYRALKERHFHRLFGQHGTGERVLVVGFSNEANAFLRYLGQQKAPAYQVVGLIDRSNRHVGRRLHGAKVLGSTDDLPEIVARFRSRNMPVSKIVVSPSKTDPAGMEAILVQATDLGLPVFTLPDASGLTPNDHGKPVRPTAIKLDDLLDRPIADIDLEPVAALLRDKVILVTGGGGSIGSGLVEQVLGYSPRRLIILDSSEHNLYAIEQRMREVFPYQDIKAILADIRDSASVRSVMAQERPSIVFHAAALKHVPIVEHNPLEGAKTNILGTLHVANAAVEYGVTVMVMISTDKAVNPTNVMGATKRFAEAYCQLLDRRADHATRFMTVRFGNVLGSSGSVVPLFSRQIEAGGPITITHPEMKRYFMSLKEAVRLVLAACSKGMGSLSGRGKIMVLHMGTQVRVVDVAHRMIRLSGLRPEIDIPIRYIGLRPGEKLYEERLAASEVVEPTADSWLQIATPRDVDGHSMALAITALEEAVIAQDEKRLLAAIRVVVPELVAAHPSLAQEVQLEPNSKTIAFAEARDRLRK